MEIIAARFASAESYAATNQDEKAMRWSTYQAVRQKLTGNIPMNHNLNFLSRDAD
ncbi:hypothetical protein GGD65_004153 [Bradyrhizobium sp. CIR18]|uniref:hypothetical protein n=1 Tax=Bradyrhizobium sp. CIR18 TaxID=2663839 RepID=UPI001606116A|nr:hypothetical protein [Bradyrhizobium sp. CIR18]MBB4363120.1 hypothetical protein [Bradyrhizobium sp. CIR18]